MSLRPKGQRRSVGIAVGAALTLIILVMGLAFANSVGAARVADNARALHWANASLGTATTTRLALVQASTFVELARSGQASAADVDFAMAQVASARAELGALEESGGAAASHPYLTHFLSPVDAVIASLEVSNTATANDMLSGDLEASYLALIDSLTAEQGEIQAMIDANTEGAARTADFVRFFLTFAVPAAAVLVYRYLARRAVREHQMAVDIEIAAERAVSHAKDEFIAGLSHELRTPLTSIYGFAEVLTDSDNGGETTRELATIIANEASEMTRMVDDLLAAARMESKGVEIVQSRTRVEDVVEGAISPFLKAGLEVSFSGGNVWVDTDAARLRHILVNLLSNAARHGGPRVGIEVSEATDTVDIEVWDNGPGVPVEQMEKLFDRFVHEGSSPLLTGSLGLGLAVASKLASLLGGKLSYQRFVDKSYFIVTIPVLPTAGDPEQEDDQPRVADVIRAMSA